MVLVFSFIAGLHDPKWAGYCSLGFAFSRIIYSAGYNVSVKGRVAGAVMCDLLILALSILAYRSVHLSGFGLEWTIILYALVSFHFLFLLSGFLIGGGGRKKIFNAEVMSHFEDVHEAALGKGTKPPVGEGYPDTGNGRYSSKLPYSDWFEFNKN